MACTIVSTPALGASDWSTFITQVAGLKRGFMEVSYTNFASTAASAIATGGVIEVAGSFYVFSETAIDYSTTTSANADLYIYAQPSAGGTTCSIVALTAACIWVDSKQGFYASAASLNRAIGGMYVGTVATFYHKYLYGDVNVQSCRERNSTRPLLRTVAEIGEWNMDSTQTKDVDTTVLVEKIVSVMAIIRPDTDNARHPLNRPFASLTGGTIAGAVNQMVKGGFAIQLYRATGGYFDSSAHDGTASTVANRGWVYIEYGA